MGPELRAIYFTSFVHEPYKMTIWIKNLTIFEVEHCPKPIVNMERTRKFASDFLWKMKKIPLVKKEESSRILNPS
jgi:deoxyribodipyrimidine photo-lyase